MEKVFTTVGFKIAPEEVVETATKTLDINDVYLRRHLQPTLGGWVFIKDTGLAADEQITEEEFVNKFKQYFPNSTAHLEPMLVDRR